MVRKELVAKLARFIMGRTTPNSHLALRNSLFIILSGALTLSSCTDKISTLGAPYYPDTVEFRTSIRTDTGFMQFSSVIHPSVPVSDTSYNLTYSSPLMLIGRSTKGTDNLESWGVLQFPVLTGDTLSRVRGIRLLLKDIPYKYGDTTTSKVDFRVYESAGSGKLSYSTTQLALTDLSPDTLGSFQQAAFQDSSDNVVAIPIDTLKLVNGKSDLSATSFAFVVTPGAGMTNVRGFGTSENVLADANSVPQLEYRVQVDTGIRTILLSPLLDMHIVKDQSVTPAHEFTLRGGTGLREFLNFNLSRPSDTAQLNPFSTINGAVLVLQIDPANSATSNLSLDTVGPSIAELTNPNDTGSSLWTVGYRNHAGDLAIRFQLQTLFEYWLRNPSLNLGLELRSGFVRRTFALSSLGVEDNTLNRWTFYGPDYPDVSKRPQLILSYSKLP